MSKPDPAEQSRSRRERIQAELRAQAIALEFLEPAVLHAALDAEGDVLIVPSAAVVQSEIAAGGAGGVVGDASLQVERAVVMQTREQGLCHRKRVAGLEGRIETEVEAQALQPRWTEPLHLRGCAGEGAVQQLAAGQRRIVARGRGL